MMNPQYRGSTVIKTMKAAAIQQWGSANEFEIIDVPLPDLADDDILVKVAYAGINPADWKIRAGFLSEVLVNTTFPYVVGLDAAGVVVATGSDAGEFTRGQRVLCATNFFQGKPGAYAEYLVVNKRKVASIPERMSFKTAAAIPIAGVTAWQALFAVDKGALQSGQKVLINGAAGGLGSFAVQFAKWAGADVATTSSDANLSYLISLGSDLPINYKTQNIHTEIDKWAPQGVDLVIDAISAGSLGDVFALLRPGGKLISIATLNADGDVQRDIAEAEKRGVTKIYASINDDQMGKELETIVKLIASGKVMSPPIESFELDQVNQAHKKIEDGHVRGKLVLSIAGEL